MVKLFFTYKPIFNIFSIYLVKLQFVICIVLKSEDAISLNINFTKQKIYIFIGSPHTSSIVKFSYGICL